jgi:putative transposase
MGMAILDDSHIKLAKLGAVKFRSGNVPKGKLKRVTISISPTGKYYAMALVDTKINPYTKTNAVVGVDLGLTDLAIQSDGVKLPNIRFDKKLAEKKHYWEKRLARRRRQALNVIHNEKKRSGRELELKDFSNYTKAKYQVARISEKIANQRLDYLHKYTTSLVKHYDIIAIEKLQAGNMMKNHNLARAIANASWNMLSNMLAYKTSWYDKELIFVDPRYTTQVDYETQVVIKHNLAVREYVNGNGHIVDRDINAAKNILKWALTPETRVTKA